MLKDRGGEMAETLIPTLSFAQHARAHAAGRRECDRYRHWRGPDDPGCLVLPVWAGAQALPVLP
jgi:hypothetical protein